MPQKKTPLVLFVQNSWRQGRQEPKTQRYYTSIFVLSRCLKSLHLCSIPWSPSHSEDLPSQPDSLGTEFQLRAEKTGLGLSSFSPRDLGHTSLHLSLGVPEPEGHKIKGI